MVLGVKRSEVMGSDNEHQARKGILIQRYLDDIPKVHMEGSHLGDRNSNLSWFADKLQRPGRR
jgi:hypothetical protein